MANKQDLYKAAQILSERREEFLKYPEEFKLVLEELKKAAREDDENDEAGDGEDHGDGYSVVDDPNEGGDDDEAAKWLKDQEGKKGEEKQEAAPEQNKYNKDWQPRTDYTPEQAAAVEGHKKNGYTHREAERMAGAHKGPMDFMSAMKSGVNPSMMSDKMMGDLKPLAKMWLEEADKKEKLNANPEVNPMKAAAGKLTQAHEAAHADYSKAYNDFLGSDEVKGLKGKDRHQAIQKWKTDYKTSNPEHEAGKESVSTAGQAFKENKGAAKQNLQDKIAHITSGGQSMPAEMSANEAMQHLGGGKTEEGYQGTIVSDPSASFAARNPKLLASLQPEQQERLKAVDSAAKSQGKVRIRKGGAQ